MEKKEKADLIIRQNGQCDGVLCDGGEENECPARSFCLAGKRLDSETLIACREFLGEPVVDDAVIGTSRTNAPSKTLLDEFAMAALTGALSNPEVMLDIAEEDLKSLAKAYATCSYEYAAAMMNERARRDEMGNVKEVK